MRTAWGGQFEFHVNRPQWQWIGARVVVDIQVRKQEAAGRAADDHFSIKSVKTPPEGAGPNELQGREGVNSQVAGDNDRTNAFDQNMTLSSQDILPSKNPLLATVPVFFEHDKSDIRPAERTKIRNFASKWQGAAPGTAGSRPASVELKAMTTASGSDVYNQGLAQRRADAVKAELAAAGFNSVNTRVAETPLGETPAAGSEDANFRRVDMIPDGGGAQTVAVHEFGHAFGLDDEYGAEFGAGRPAAGHGGRARRGDEEDDRRDGREPPGRRRREQQQHHVGGRRGPAAALLDVPRGAARDLGDRGVGARAEAGSPGRPRRRPGAGAGAGACAGRAVRSPAAPGCSPCSHSCSRRAATPRGSVR